MPTAKLWLLELNRYPTPYASCGLKQELARSILALQGDSQDEPAGVTLISIAYKRNRNVRN